ncbi:MAG: hypothetical protein J3Q66DRAFT_354067 [Benniella sp.]|nr:MAG: hypothetical protein J3Q66DRAFT_354067 [Benniella sp.]
MSNALDPLRRLAVHLNARLAHFRALPANFPPPAPPHHLHVPHTAPVVPFARPPPQPAFGQFQVRVPYPSYKDGPQLLTHLNQQANTLVRNLFVPEPVRVAAVDYACRSVGRPQMASLLSRGGVQFHQPLKFSVPHGFAKNVGLNSTRGFSSFQPAMNGPVKMLAQMYAKPLGSLPAHVQMLSPKESQHPCQPLAKKKEHRNKSRRGGEIKKRAASSPCNISRATIKAFLNRASLVEQQHQIMTVCNTNNAPITTATAISLAKVAGMTPSQLEELPKLQSSDDCPTDVDMCFMLDASPLWHLDTMISALHTDSFREPKELNRTFIEDLLQVTNAQYQHFLEVAAILQKLVKCPESREISVEGYELRIHFERTGLYEVTNFLRQLSIDPKSPHFELVETYMDPLMAPEPYFPEASVNEYYAPSLSDNETWDDCNSLQGSLMMYTNSDRCSSVVSFATMESLPNQESPWEEGEVKESESDAITFENETEDQVAPQEEESIQEQELLPVELTAGTPILPTPSANPWDNDATAPVVPEEKQCAINEEYFDGLRGFLGDIETAHRHFEAMCGPSSSTTR